MAVWRLVSRFGGRSNLQRTGGDLFLVFKRRQGPVKGGRGYGAGVCKVWSSAYLWNKVRVQVFGLRSRESEPGSCELSKLCRNGSSGLINENLSTPPSEAAAVKTLLSSPGATTTLQEVADPSPTFPPSGVRQPRCPGLRWHCSAPPNHNQATPHTMGNVRMYAKAPTRASL